MRLTPGAKLPSLCCSVTGVSARELADGTVDRIVIVEHGLRHEAGDEWHHDDPSVLPETAENRIRHVATMVHEFPGAGGGKNDGRHAGGAPAGGM